MEDQARVRAKVLEKIHKLLKLAKDGRGNETEAETALRQAQALMARFNIDEAEATKQDLSSNPDAIVRAWCKAGYHAKAVMATVPKWANIIATGVAKLYECRIAFARGGDVNAVGVVFGGYHVDVQVASWTFEYLMECVRRSSDRFDKALREGDARTLANEFNMTPELAVRLLMLPSKGRKSDFRFGMAAQLQLRLAKLRKEREEAQQQSAAGRSLVIAKEAALSAHFGRDPGTKSMMARNSTGAAQAGYSAGDKVRLDPNPIQARPSTAAPPLLGR